VPYIPKRFRDVSIALNIIRYRKPPVYVSTLPGANKLLAAYPSWHVGYRYAFSSKMQVHHKYGGYGRQNTEDDYKEEINTCTNIMKSFSSHHRNRTGQAYSVVKKQEN